MYPDNECIATLKIITSMIIMRCSRLATLCRPVLTISVCNVVEIFADTLIQTVSDKIFLMAKLP
jgi:hypothetical protein